MIRDHLQPTSRFQHALGERHELRLQQPSLVMAGLGPGIGEINMQDRQAVFRHEFRQKKTRLGPHRAGVRAVIAAKAIAGISPEPAGPFDAEKIDLGSCLGLLGQEGSLAAADLQFDRMIVAKYLGPVQGLG